MLFEIEDPILAKFLSWKPWLTRWKNNLQITVQILHGGKTIHRSKVQILQLSKHDVLSGKSIYFPT